MESPPCRAWGRAARASVVFLGLAAPAALGCATPEPATTRAAETAASGHRDSVHIRPVLAPATLAQVMVEVRRPGARATLVNVWASWCVPCRQEFPDLVRLERTHRKEGLRVLFVSTDFDSADAVKFLAEQGVNYLSLFKVGDDMSFIDGLSPKWSGALPATFVYDATGRLVRFWEGRADYSRFEEAALEAMKGTAAPPQENAS